MCAREETLMDYKWRHCKRWTQFYAAEDDALTHHDQLDRTRRNEEHEAERRLADFIHVEESRLRGIRFLIHTHAHTLTS
jgi:hypothetical protein